MELDYLKPGCVIVITGAASGIGRSLALALVNACPQAERSTVCVVIADQRLQPAEKVAHEITELGAQSIAIQCDVSCETAVSDLAETVEKDFGKVNLLFNVAGVNIIRKLHETSASDVEWLFAVNVFGICHMVRHFVPLLKVAAARSEIAHIVNMSSGYGVAVPAMGSLIPSAYAGTKHAVVGLSDALKKDLAPEGIGVSVVCPGAVKTNAWNSTSFRQEQFGGPEQGSEASKERLHTWGQDPNETAALILERLGRRDFYLFPLDDTSRQSMKNSIDARYAELRQSLDDSLQ